MFKLKTINLMFDVETNIHIYQRISIHIGNGKELNLKPMKQIPVQLNFYTIRKQTCAITGEFFSFPTHVCAFHNLSKNSSGKLAKHLL